MHAIFNFMQELFTRENVTFAIAVFGAVGTAWNLFQSRRKIEFIPIGFKLKDDNELIVHFEIINHSRIAISIVNISYLYDGVHYSCSKERAIGESIYHERMRLKNLQTSIHNLFRYNWWGSVVLRNIFDLNSRQKFIQIFPNLRVFKYLPIAERQLK